MKVVVIGAGLIGMLTARELVVAGAEVIICDQGYVGRESSWAGGGILSPLYPWRYDDRITYLAQWGQKHYPSLLEMLHADTGIDPQYVKSGLLMTNLSAQESQQAQQWAEKFHYQIERIAASDVTQIQKDLIAGEGKSLWMSSVGQVRNPRLLQSLRKWLESHGVIFYEKMKVTTLLSEYSRICGVNLEEQKVIRSDKVILCAGAWSHLLLSKYGISINQKPVRGQMLLFKADPDLVKTIVLKEGHYVVPRQDGRVLVGSTMEYVGYDKSNTEEAIAELRVFVKDTLPGLSKAPLEMSWAGLRPGSPEGVPWISEVHGYENLYINSGHFRNGVVMGLASAKLASNLILETQPIIEPDYYRC